MDGMDRLKTLTKYLSWETYTQYLHGDHSLKVKESVQMMVKVNLKGKRWTVVALNSNSQNLVWCNLAWSGLHPLGGEKKGMFIIDILKYDCFGVKWIHSSNLKTCHNVFDSHRTIP